MADNKKYYYMRLKENFFDTDEMVYLEGLEEGYLFSNILLKLYLRSLKNDGVLMMNSLVPYDARMISRFTNHSLSTVEKALFEFNKLGLIEMLDSGQMYMSNIELFVGKTTTEADRKRLGRMKVEQKLIENKEGGQMSDKCPPEKELEKELELKLEIELVKPVVQDSLERDFNEFYQHYPVKKGKANAVKAYAKARKNKHSHETIMNGLMDYKQELQAKGTDKQFIKQPAKFLNGEHFNDEYDFTPAYSNNSYQQQQTMPWEVDAYGSSTSKSINVNDRNDVQKLLQY